MENFNQVNETELENLMAQIENDIDINKTDAEVILFQSWDKAVQEVRKIIPKDSQIPSLLDNPDVKIKLLQIKPGFSAQKFSLLLNSTPNDPVLRAILIELFPLLTEYKAFKFTTAPVSLNEEERSLVFYVGGRVVMALYFKTRNSFFEDLKAKTKTIGNKRNCWILKDEINEWFVSAELLIKGFLNNEVSQVDVKNITQKWMEKNNSSISKISKEHHLLISQMIARYTRTRCHRYARRATQLYQSSKKCTKKSTSKGSGASFREKLK